MGTSRDDKNELRAEYLRRAKIVQIACDRSNAMERDFLDKKVLNAEANAALEDFGNKRAAFGEWLLQVSDDLFAVSAKNAPLDSGMDNVFASLLGQIALDAGRSGIPGVGDSIDRGLILLRLLNKHGFTVSRSDGGSHG